jgi:flagellin-specific chaperone FliS
MSERLTAANIKRDASMILDVIKLMEELNQGWRAITG